MAKIRVGTSGWSYDVWQGSFYPEDLPQKRRLRYLSRRFDSTEINGSFHSLQTPETYRKWYGQTPARFRFSVKGSAFITHSKQLRDPKTPLANFLASGVLALGEKLGPLLWQLPPRMPFSPSRLRGFLDLLPHDTRAAARLARKHDDTVSGRAWTRPGSRHRLRHALEVRNPSFFVPGFVRLCRDHGVALVISDAADWPRVEEITAGFVYIRLHGGSRTYASGYRRRSLRRWADRIRSWAAGKEPGTAQRITNRIPPRRQGRDVYVYLDNDKEGNAPRDAMRLAGILDGGT